MKKLILIITIFTFTSISYSKIIDSNSTEHSFKSFFIDKYKMKSSTINYLKRGEVLSNADVDTKKDSQSFTLFAAAVHPKPCIKVLKKISKFENMQNIIPYINRSQYDDDKKLLTIHANHTLLPFPMIVHIIVDRPSTPGVYPFTFPTGIFKGLKGEFEVVRIKRKCALYARSQWHGQDTGIPDMAIELFAETLTRIGGEILTRKIK